MARPLNVDAQRDFSSGEVDPTLKRNEENPIYKAGARQCANFRILNSKGLANRFGRSAQFLDGPRVDEVLMGPGAAFTLCFSAGTLNVRQAGAIVFTASGYPWTALTVGSLTWAVYLSQVFITFAGLQPLVLTWAGGTSFSIASYVEEVLGNQKRTPFYRISPLGVTMQPSAATAPGTSITLTFSAGMNLVAGHVGTRMRYVGRQVLITAVNVGAQTATATIEESLYSGLEIASNSTTDVRTIASIGDVVIGSVSGAKGQIVSFSSSTVFTVQLLTGIVFQVGTADFIVGPGGSLSTASAVTVVGPQAVTTWDDEVMNAFRGYPASCFVDQNRLGLCNFPSVPTGIAWSAIAAPTDLYVPTTAISADNAIFEIAPAKNQVLYVAAGPDSNEFVFCDNAVYQIPISAQNPLAPGSVAFNLIDEGSAAVQPRFMQGMLIYVNAGGTMVRAIIATGAYSRPYESRILTEDHAHLLNGPVAIAAPGADGSFPERYFYVLNGDGTAIACKVAVANGQLAAPPGWFRINNSFGSLNWISTRAADIWFVATYAGASGPIAELLDNTQYLDMAFAVNSPPTALVPPGGKGPLWWAPSQPVTLLDLGTRQLGVYQVDANGFLIPQFFGGENLTSAQLVAGHHWTAILEPFVPAAGPGQDFKQRMVRRKVARVAAYVQSSTGFLWTRLFSGPLTPASPALGTVVGSSRVTTYNQDDNPVLAPPLREGAVFWRPSGRAYDPRIAIMKDTPGPLTINEIGMEVTV